MVALDLVILCGIAWFVGVITSGKASLTVPPAEAIQTVTRIGGGAIGIVTAILLVAFFVHRRNGN